MTCLLYTSNGDFTPGITREKAAVLIEAKFKTFVPEDSKVKSAGGRPKAKREVDGAKVKEVRGDESQADFARFCRFSIDVLQEAESGLATDKTISGICRSAKAKGLKLKPKDFWQGLPQKPQ